MEEQYNVRAIMYHIMNIMSPKVLEKSNQFKIYLDSTMPVYLYGDAERIKQSILSMLSSAMEHAGEGMIILMVGAEDNGYPDTIDLCVTVAHAGAGMEQDQIDKLKRKLGTRLEVSSNRGLGAVLSYKVMQEIALSTVAHAG